MRVKADNSVPGKGINTRIWVHFPWQMFGRMIALFSIALTVYFARKTHHERSVWGLGRKWMSGMSTFDMKVEFGRVDGGYLRYDDEEDEDDCL